MKKQFCLLIIIFMSISAFGQNGLEVPNQNISTDNNVEYRLFSTKNMYVFLKLDTKNGQMWQVQWSTKGTQLEIPLSLVSLVKKEDEKNGRFFLYPTINIYNFILLDQIDGRVWQVQWSDEVKGRMIIPIY